IYVASDLDKTNGNVELKITTTSESEICPIVSDVLNINFVQGPLANAGGNVEKCASDKIVSLSGKVSNSNGGTWVTAGDGHISPASNVLDVTYTFGPLDISNGQVRVTLNPNPVNGCTGTSDYVDITIIET